MKKILFIFSIASLASIAIPALAAVKTFKELVSKVFVEGILQPLVPLLIGLAVAVFFYGVIITMLSEGGEKKEEGKQYMLWGVIGIFVMVSVWGLVAILINSFNLDTRVRPVKIGTVQIQQTVPNYWG